MARQKRPTIPTQMEQERSNTLEGLFITLNNKFKSQYTETIKSLKFRKLGRQTIENADEWMGRLRLTAVECNYNGIDRQLKEQFIHWHNDNDILAEIITELTKAKESTTVTSINLGKESGSPKSPVHNNN